MWRGDRGRARREPGTHHIIKGKTLRIFFASYTAVSSQVAVVCGARQLHHLPVRKQHLRVHLRERNNRTGESCSLAVEYHRSFIFFFSIIPLCCLLPLLLLFIIYVNSSSTLSKGETWGRVLEQCAAEIDSFMQSLESGATAVAAADAAREQELREGVAAARRARTMKAGVGGEKGVGKTLAAGGVGGAPLSRRGVGRSYVSQRRAPAAPTPVPDTTTPLGTAAAGVGVGVGAGAAAGAGASVGSGSAGSVPAPVSVGRASAAELVRRELRELEEERARLQAAKDALAEAVAKEEERVKALRARGPARAEGAP